MKVFLDVENMQLCVEKISMYRKEESILFDSIKSILGNINSCYSISCSKDIINLSEELNSKMDTFIKVHDNNILVLNTKIQRHIELVNKNSMLLSDNNS